MRVKSNISNKVMTPPADASSNKFNASAMLPARAYNVEQTQI